MLQVFKGLGMLIVFTSEIKKYLLKLFKLIIMSKIKINYFVDMLMFIFFIVTSVTGLISFLLPRGRSLYLGIPRGDLVFMHSWAGLILIVLVGLHLILHWSWIKNMTRHLFKK